MPYDRLTHVQRLFTRNPSPHQYSRASLEYLLLPPRSAQPAAPARITPRAFRATGSSCLLVEPSGSQGPALAQWQGISRKLKSHPFSDVLYSSSELVFKGCSQRFKQNGGVRQGDQLSGPLFNGTAYLGIEDLDQNLMYKINEDVGIAEGLFADDEFLAAEGSMALQYQVDKLILRYMKCGLQMNTSKCKTIVIVYNAQRKKYIVDSTPVITINGDLVPSISQEKTYKYLGVKLGAGNPNHKGIFESLRVKLERIDKSCLKPQQRMLELRRHIIPSLYHVLIFNKATKGSLKTLDRNIQFFVTKWCHLPKDTLDSFIHAKIKDGGLGIPSLGLRIPRMSMQRHMRLSASLDPLVQAIYTSIAGQASITKDP